MKIPFSPPYIDQAVIDEVTDTLRSGWITTGPKTRALEEEIRRLCGAGYPLPDDFNIFRNAHLLDHLSIIDFRRGGNHLIPCPEAAALPGLRR